jgi:hypothetical protein
MTKLLAALRSRVGRTPPSLRGSQHAGHYHRRSGPRLHSVTLPLCRSRWGQSNPVHIRRGFVFDHEIMRQYTAARAQDNRQHERFLGHEGALLMPSHMSLHHRESFSTRLARVTFWDWVTRAVSAAARAAAWNPSWWARQAVPWLDLCALRTIPSTR